MSSKKKIDGVVLGVIICSVVFLCYQYFMVHENGVKLLKENAYDVQQMKEQMDYGDNASSVQGYVTFIRNNEPENINNYDIAAFTRLVNALKGLSEMDETPLVQTKIKTLQQQVNRYVNLTSQQKPTQLKAMFATANSTIQDFNVKRDKDLKAELKKLEEEAAAIDPNAPKKELLHQEQSYYQQAADVLAMVDKKF